LHPPLHLRDERLDVGSRGLARVHDKIGMLVGYARAAPCQPFQPGTFYQPCGVSARWVTKDRAATGLVRGLRRAAAREQATNALADRFRLRRLERKRDCDEPLVRP